MAKNERTSKDRRFTLNAVITYSNSDEKYMKKKVSQKQHWYEPMDDNKLKHLSKVA